MIKAIWSAPAALLLTTACAETPEPADPDPVSVEEPAPEPAQEPAPEPGGALATEPVVDDGPDECGASAVQSYIGKEGTEAVETELEAKAEGRFRWLPPGTIVTEDYVPSRMNVDLNDAGVIVRIRCG